MRTDSVSMPDVLAFPIERDGPHLGRIHCDMWVRRRRDANVGGTENTTAIDQPAVAAVSPRAVAIARGLRRTGRIRDLRAGFSGHGTDDDAERWIVLPT